MYHSKRYILLSLMLYVDYVHCAYTGINYLCLCLCLIPLAFTWEQKGTVLVILQKIQLILVDISIKLLQLACKLKTFLNRFFRQGYRIIVITGKGSAICSTFPFSTHESVILSLSTVCCVPPKELLYLHRGALTLIFGPFGADVLL